MTSGEPDTPGVRIKLRELVSLFNGFVDGLESRGLTHSAGFFRDTVNCGEEPLAVDMLAESLVFGRVALTPAERDTFRHIIEAFENPSYDYDFLYNRSAVVAALNVIGRHPPRRGIGRLTGGHEPRTGRRATTEFPPDWGFRQVNARGFSVHLDPAAPRRRLANGRGWASGVRDGIDIAVLSEASGSIRVVIPLGGPGVRRNPDEHSGPPTRPTLPEIIVGVIGRRLRDLLVIIADQLPVDEVAIYRALEHTGEWEELADVLAARLTRPDVTQIKGFRGILAVLLECFDLPVEGCEYLNRRDEILEGL